MKKGYTIIELLVVLVILGLLIGAATLGLNRARRNNRDALRLKDVYAIAKAIDQSAANTHGIYPQNVSAQGNEADMCATEIGSLDLSAFSRSTLPSDPSAVSPREIGCTGMLNGYTYHTDYGRANNMAVQQKVAYSLEVGLENPRPSDDTFVKAPSELSGLDPLTTDFESGRYRYVLNGPYCGSSLTFNGASADSCYR